MLKLFFITHSAPKDRNGGRSSGAFVFFGKGRRLHSVEAPTCSLNPAPASRLHLIETPACSLKPAPVSRLHSVESPACSLKPGPASRLHSVESPTCSLKPGPASRLHSAESPACSLKPATAPSHPRIMRKIPKPQNPGPRPPHNKKALPAGKCLRINR